MVDLRNGRGRSLGLLDLIIVVAASAVWMAVTRLYAGRSNMISIWYVRDFGFITIVRDQGSYALIMASLAMLLIRLRGPRPSRRRLWRQPGLAASLGATVGIVVGEAGLVANWAASNRDIQSWVLRWFSEARPCAAAGVFGAWVALRLSGRWRSERSAIDRIAQVIGWLWIVEYLIVEMPATRWFRIIDSIARRGF